MMSVILYHFHNHVFILCSNILTQGGFHGRRCHGMLIRLIRGGKWFPYHCRERNCSFYVHMLVTSFKYYIEKILNIIAFWFRQLCWLTDHTYQKVTLISKYTNPYSVFIKEKKEYFQNMIVDY